MTNQLLAQYANTSLYSAMAVFTLAMLGYALYLAALVPHRDRVAAARQSAHERDELLVGAGMPAGAAAGGTATTAAGGDQAAPEPVTPGGEEVSVRGRKAAGIAGTLTWLGALLLVLSATLRGLSVHRWPLGNMFEFAVFGAMFTALAFSIWSTRRDLRWLGLFVTAPVLLTLGLAITVWYTEAAELLPSLKSYWLAIHVTVATLSVGLFALGASASALYLLKDAFQRSSRPSVLDRFPPARNIERLAYSVHIVAFPLWTFTLIAGATWARQAWGSYWNWDPKEVWTFVIWVVYAAYLHSRATSGWRRQATNYLALAGWACIIINYTVVNVFFVSQHSYSGL
ncbi:MAG TPA: c-type cytochrome biogenesis protein CcsB [Acidimicrobiales bacterium]